MADLAGLPAGELVTALRAAGCVFAEDEARLLTAETTDPRRLAAMLARRVAGEPLEQVLGWAELGGLRVVVEPGVFVPRQRSRLLVTEAVRLDASSGPVVVDLCCGTGALGLAVLSALGRGELHAADVDPAAVHCARRNVEPAGGVVHAGDLFDALPADLRGRVDLLLVNAPYVPTDAVATMPPEARLHEHLVALDGGADGLDVQRRVTAAAGSWLAPGGHLLVETSEGQAPATAAAFAAGRLTARVVRDDDLDATVVVGSATDRRRRAR